MTYIVKICRYLRHTKILNLQLIVITVNFQVHHARLRVGICVYIIYFKSYCFVESMYVKINLFMNNNVLVISAFPPILNPYS